MTVAVVALSELITTLVSDPLKPRARLQEIAERAIPALIELLYRSDFTALLADSAKSGSSLHTGAVPALTESVLFVKLQTIFTADSESVDGYVCRCWRLQEYVMRSLPDWVRYIMAGRLPRTPIDVWTKPLLPTRPEPMKPPAAGTESAVSHAFGASAGRDQTDEKYPLPRMSSLAAASSTAFGSGSGGSGAPPPPAAEPVTPNEYSAQLLAKFLISNSPFETSETSSADSLCISRIVTDVETITLRTDPHTYPQPPDPAAGTARRALLDSKAASAGDNQQKPVAASVDEKKKQTKSSDKTADKSSKPKEPAQPTQPPTKYALALLKAAPASLPPFPASQDPAAWQKAVSFGVMQSVEGAARLKRHLPSYAADDNPYTKEEWLYLRDVYFQQQKYLMSLWWCLYYSIVPWHATV